MNKLYVPGCACLPQRYVLSVFILVGLVVCYLMRVCVNLALNEMTFKLNATESHSGTKQHFCPVEASTANATKTRAEFDWDQHLQHDIIKSIFIGYIVAHVPAGVLADMFGGKHIFGIGILVSSILSLCFPFLARLSPYAFIFGRILQGFGQELDSVKDLEFPLENVTSDKKTCRAGSAGLTSLSG
ncbi:hypothetical protein J6590_097904 [Homalodisca vitripennis]|nr:hypothetical protein J6590_097904 [Homalodisca vitripennis]